MFAQQPEGRMHRVRWVLTIGWLLLIASLFYDPWTSALTWSFFKSKTECIYFQGNCLTQQPYPIGTTLFWGAVVPAGIFILLIFGHEVWRRICPLSFLSQIPRALGRQRQFKRENAKTGKVRYELAKVKPDSWLGKNYPYLQFGWLFVGLCGRILFFNADRLVLGLWLVFTIACAIAVGYYYGGKSWCQYFCPMAPVQKIYSEPGGLFASKAHMSDQTITQSMCRVVLPEGKEQSACVACQNPCIDIDAERAYWDELNKPQETFLRYAYIGLAVGYFVYYYLYAGSWSYYFSGIWSQQGDQLSSLFSPGFYISGQAINVPKIIAVPLTIGIFTAIFYWLGIFLEKRVKAFVRKRYPKISSEVIRHRIFTISTFVIFNIFFIFGGRPLVLLLPVWVQYVYDLGLVLLSTLWLYKTWRRTPELYSRENLANRFRKQLIKLDLNVSDYLDGKSVNDLNIHEVYVLAKVLPGFTKENRHKAYKGVVREALEEGAVNYSSSLEVLQQMRRELGITDDEHRQVLEELGVEDPELLNPDRQRSMENQIRLSGYRKSLERLMALQNKRGNAENVDQLLEDNIKEINALRQQYSVTPSEEEWILSGFSPGDGDRRRNEFLLEQLPDLITSHHALHQPILREHHQVLTLLQETVYHKKELIVRSILEYLAHYGKDDYTLKLAESLGAFNPSVVADLLESEGWSGRLDREILARLTQVGDKISSCSLEYSRDEILNRLEILLYDQNPLIQTASLYLIAQLNPERGKLLANERNNDYSPSLLKNTAKQLLSVSPPVPGLNAFPDLEKVTYLYNSDFFHRTGSETLMTLADRASVKVYKAKEVITEAGDTCRELLLLIEGDASIQYYQKDGEVKVEKLKLGQTLDELDVLAHSTSQNTIIAESQKTRILAIPVEMFDDLLDGDGDFARRVLELESRQLQRFAGGFAQV